VSVVAYSSLSTFFSSSSSGRARLRRVAGAFLGLVFTSSADEESFSVYFGFVDADWRVELRVPAMLRVSCCLEYVECRVAHAWDAALHVHASAMTLLGTHITATSSRDSCLV
jgi:hypothetical protein